MKASHILMLGLSFINTTYALPLPKQTLMGYQCDTCANFTHTTLSKTWAIRNNPLSDEFNNQQKAYSYRQVVTLEALQQGVALTTLGKGAVIRIAPVKNEKTLPDLIIKSKQQTLALKDASETVVGNSVFKLKDSLGTGKFVLSTQAKSANAKQTRFIVSVLDANSDLYLAVKTGKTHYQYGETITANISFPEDDFDEPVSDVSGFILKPNGEQLPLTITKVAEGEYQGEIALSDINNWNGENGYIHVEVNGFIDDSGVKRNAQTAFSYSIPSATITAVDKVSTDPLSFNAAVDVMTNSRYLLTAVLYHKDNTGKLQPADIVQVSQWLEKGDNNIAINFDKPIDNPGDYALGYLQLVDYGQMKPVFRYNNPIVLSQLK